MARYYGKTPFELIASHDANQLHELMTHYIAKPRDEEYLRYEFAYLRYSICQYIASSFSTKRVNLKIDDFILDFDKTTDIPNSDELVVDMEHFKKSAGVQVYPDNLQKKIEQKKREREARKRA